MNIKIGDVFDTEIMYGLVTVTDIRDNGTTIETTFFDKKNGRLEKTVWFPHILEENYTKIRSTPEDWLSILTPEGKEP